MILKATKAAFNEAKHLVLFEKLKPFVGVACLVRLVNDGKISLYEVHADDAFLGILMARIDMLYDNRPELCIMHASAVIKPPIPLSSILNPLFDQLARESGCGSVRVHADKRGLERLLESNGYQLYETVYRKEINV